MLDWLIGCQWISCACTQIYNHETEHVRITQDILLCGIAMHAIIFTQNQAVSCTVYNYIFQYSQVYVDAVKWLHPPKHKAIHVKQRIFSEVELKALHQTIQNMMQHQASLPVSNLSHVTINKTMPASWLKRQSMHPDFLLLLGSSTILQHQTSVNCFAGWLDLIACSSQQLAAPGKLVTWCQMDTHDEQKKYKPAW